VRVNPSPSRRARADEFVLLAEGPGATPHTLGGCLRHVRDCLAHPTPRVLSFGPPLWPEDLRLAAADLNPALDEASYPK